MTSMIVLLLDGHEVVPEHQFHGHRTEQVVLDPEVFQVNKLGAIAGGEGLGLGAFVHAHYSGARRTDCGVCHK